jgi:hypothetical protein
VSRLLHIVASCAQTKSVGASKELHLGAVPAGLANVRAAEWACLRDRADAETLAARDLYSGTYWATVRRLSSGAADRGYQVQLWVASAGYGLVSADALLKSYSATFAAGNKDSVPPVGLPRGQRVRYLRDWWNSLSRTRGLRDLPKKDSKASILVIAGPAYIEAMHDDLDRCAARLAHTERLVIVTSETGAAPAHLAGNVVPSEARFIHKLGGSLPILHARVAEHLLKESRGRPLNARSLRTHAEAILAVQPAWTTPLREKGDDAEVLAFIRTAVRRNPALGYTRALRDYRASGKACEQKRFKSLFQSVAGVIHAA